MSYNLVRSVTINVKENKVFFTSACNNVRPRTYSKEEAPYYSELLKEKGVAAVKKEILYMFYQGVYQNKTSNYAKAAILFYNEFVVQKEYLEEAIKSKLYEFYLNYNKRNKDLHMLKHKEFNQFIVKKTKASTFFTYNEDASSNKVFKGKLEAKAYALLNYVSEDYLPHKK